jgi:hypothetical protein
VARRYARPGSSRGGEPAHELPGYGNNLPVQVEFDRLLRHSPVYGPEFPVCNLVLGLNAYTFPQPMT